VSNDRQRRERHPGIDVEALGQTSSYARGHETLLFSGNATLCEGSRQMHGQELGRRYDESACVFRDAEIRWTNLAGVALSEIDLEEANLRAENLSEPVCAAPTYDHSREVTVRARAEDLKWTLQRPSVRVHCSWGIRVVIDPFRDEVQP
jgi:hypothetical protein